VRRLSPSIGLALALLSAPAGGAGPAAAERLQGFVSARLLSAWCRSEQPLDTEACLSYLRGVFDTLQAVAHPESAALIERHDGGPAICISPLAPITQLKSAATRLRDAEGDPGEQQGAVFLLRALRDAFPCAAPGPADE